MKNIDISKLPKSVQKEAALLLVHATTEERNRLSFERLIPSSSYHCIYGLMTGDCRSGRAKELMRLCFKGYTEHHFSFLSIHNTFSQNLKNATAIEASVVHPVYSKYNENLINHLKQDL